MFTVEPGFAVTEPRPVAVPKITVPIPVEPLSARRSSVPLVGTLMFAVIDVPLPMTMFRAAESSRVVGAVHAMLVRTVISPAWVPPMPVETCTFEVASAFWIVVALMTLSLAFASKNVLPAFEV